MGSRRSSGGHDPGVAAALWQQVEGTGDLLGIVMRQLAEVDREGEDLGRAGSVCRA